jgi:hypothetical protein
MNKYCIFHLQLVLIDKNTRINPINLLVSCVNDAEIHRYSLQSKKAPKIFKTSMRCPNTNNFIKLKVQVSCDSPSSDIRLLYIHLELVLHTMTV